MRKYLTPHYLGKHRHVFASDRTDVSRGILGFPDDPGRGGVDFKTNGAKYIWGGVFTSFKRLVSISRGRGWFFEFEAIRTEPRSRRYLDRPLIAMLFANDTWGSKFDWLLQGDDDTTV